MIKQFLDKVLTKFEPKPTAVQVVRTNLYQEREIQQRVTSIINKQVPVLVQRALSKRDSSVVINDDMRVHREAEIKEGQDQTTFLKVYEQNIWTYAAVDAIARNGAKLPIRIFDLTKKPDNDDEEGKLITDGESFELLNSPNPYMSKFNLIYATIAYLQLTGNNYWEKSSPDMPEQVYVLRPDYTTVLTSPQELITGYAYNPNGVQQKLEKEKVFRVALFHPRSELYGMGATQPAGASIILDVYTRTYAKNFFKQGGNVDLYAQVPGDLDNEEAKRLKQELNTMWGGVQNSHEIRVLDQGTEIKQIGIQPDKTLLPEHKKSNMEEILTAFNVPPIMVGLPNDTHYNNAKEQKIFFWEETMMPLMRQLEDALNKEFYTPFDMKMKFDFSDIAVLQEDLKLKSETGKTLIESGQWSQNEVRKVIWNIKPAEDEAADKLIVPKGGGQQQGMMFEARFVNPEDKNKPADKPKKKDKPGPRTLSKKELLEKRQKVIAMFNSFFQFGLKKLEIMAKKIMKIQEDVVISSLNKFKKTFSFIKQDIVKDAITALDKETKNIMRLMINSETAITKKFIQDEYKRINNEVISDQVLKELTSATNDRLEKLAQDSARSITTTTQTRVQERLEDLVRKDASISEMTANIQRAFDVENKGTAVWSRTIARTETLKVSGITKIETMQKSGFTHIEWISAGPPDDRSDHSSLDGQIKKFGELFPTAHGGLRFPGDPTGNVADLVNCRCTFVESLGK